MSNSQNTRRVVVDPVTRIEGHLRVQAEIDANGVITDAMSIEDGVATSMYFGGVGQIKRKAQGPALFTRLQPCAPSKTPSASRSRRTPTSSAT